MQSKLFRRVSKKHSRRARAILTNSISSLLPPALNIAVSTLVVRAASVELWGQFVRLLIVLNFGVYIVAWGNKEFLLRAFSRTPAHIGRNWQTSLITRMLLFGGLCLVLAWMDWPLVQRVWAMVWALGLVVAQSNEALIIYHKDFGFSILVEMGAMGLIAGGILALNGNLTVDKLAALFGGTHLLRAGILTLRYRRYTLPRETASPIQSRFSPAFFPLAFPFFLLGFSGMLQSRMDLCAVNFYLSERDVGQYQVFISLMIYLQALANFILLPFVKNLYRLERASIRRISVRLTVFGVLFLAPALGAAALALRFVYALTLPPAFFIIGGLFVLPIYYYLPIIYRLYKENRQNTVLWVNLIGIAVNFALNMLLLPRFEALGAITATAASQWVMLGIYLWQN